MTGTASWLGRVARKKKRQRQPPAAPAVKPTKTALAVRELPEPGPMTAGKMTLAVQMVREGWSAKEISDHLFVKRDEVEVWLSIYEATRIELTPKVGAGEAPAAFSPIDNVREIAASKLVPSSTRLRACQILMQESDQRMKVDWAGLRIEDIPAEFRNYLAGRLAEYITTEGVDDEFLGGTQAERDLFGIVGVLVDSNSDAQELLDRYRKFVDDLRAEAKRRQNSRKLRSPAPRYAAEWFNGHDDDAIEADAEELDGEEMSP